MDGDGPSVQVSCRLAYLPASDTARASDDSPFDAPCRDYRVWTTAIGDHFFPLGAGTAPVYLSFDDALATQIGRAFGGGFHDFEIAVASVIDADDESPFRRVPTHCGDHPGVLGVLAAQVLAATRMGSFTADAATAYWKPFQRAFTADHPLKEPAKDALDGFWRLAKSHYDGSGRGRLSIQTTLRGFRSRASGISICRFSKRSFVRRIARSCALGFASIRKKGTCILPSSLLI
jgi:hypothetical protein